LVILAAARADLRQQRDYFARTSIAVAERFLTTAEAAFQRLAQMPGMGTLKEADHPALGRVRQWRIHGGFEKYLIYYRETDQGIEVLRVVHGARDIPTLLAEEADEPTDK
jgi:toxin ParE1/3/4